MEKNDNFTEIKKIIRNIINNDEIESKLNNIVIEKNLNDKLHIKNWVLFNVRKFFLNKEEVNNLNYEDLTPNQKDLVKTKNINSPYHVVRVNPETINEIKHCIDYLLDEFKEYRDLSRLTFDQAKINADSWLKNRLRKLSDKEDWSNIHKVIEIDDKTWVNIRSHTALQRESKLMNHCIESFWDKDFPNYKIAEHTTNYYSLRDKNNKPLITVDLAIHLMKKDNNTEDMIRSFALQEVKEKNNENLSNHNRDYLTALLNHLVKKTDFLNIQDKTTMIHNDYEFRKITSFNEIVKNKQKYQPEKDTYLKFNNYKDDFPVEDLLRSCEFEELELNQSIVKESKKISAKKITAENIENNNFCLESEMVTIKNLNKCNVEILNKKNKDCLYIIIENSLNCSIKINSNSKNFLYVIKNSKNISLENLYEKIK